MKKKFCLLLWALTVFSTGFAESKAEYSPNIVAGDGKNGNVWAQWTQNVKEAPVKEVRMRIQRVKGDGNTFVNLRFGKKGHTLDGGKRIYLKDGKETKVTWDVGGVSPGGQPLLLNAYGGEVKILKVAIIQQ